MSIHRALLVLCCAVFLCTAASLCAASSQSYIIQRCIGESGQWETITSFSLARPSPDASARLTASPAQDVELTAAVKSALGDAAFVRYRLLPAPPTDAAASEGVMVALSPCSLVRGFEAVDARTVVLREQLGLVVGPGTEIIGLQVASDTNTFHAKMTDGDACDGSVLSLFPAVRVRAGVHLVPPAPLRSAPDYAQLEKFAQREGESEGKRRTQKRGPDAGTGEEEEDNKEDKRSFLQKYWPYLILPFLFSLIQNVIMKQ